MHIAITGGAGFVGGFITAAALQAGHEVTLLARHKPEGLAGCWRFQRWALGEAADLAGVDAVVHAAFAHVPGRFRGGEGEDPAAFLQANRDGSLRLIDTARKAGVSVLLQLSTRAVFDGYPPGTLLTEDLPPHPTSLYGEVKAELEAALTAAASADFHGISLRATGVYGVPKIAGQSHKWSRLLADLVAGRAIMPRVSTELHGDDLAVAVLMLLEVARGGPAGMNPPYADRNGLEFGVPAIAHASDIMLDHRDLAAAVARHLGRCDIPLPTQSDAGRVSALDYTKLRGMGWHPGGRAAFDRTLVQMLSVS